MIALIEALSAGNAVRLILSPPPGAADWRILRRTSDTITGPDDAGAVRVADWCRAEVWLDDEGLVNGTRVFYRVFYRNAAGAPITPAPDSVSVIPAHTARSPEITPLRVIRQRIEAGLAAAVADGRLKPPSGRVPIVIAPMMEREKIRLPVVSIHMESDRPMERAVAEYIASDELADGDIDITEGWLSEVTINIVGVSLNPDERVSLGEVLKHIILANLPIFSAYNIIRPAMTLTHSELVPEEKAAPLYVAAGTFTCIAPSTVTATGPAVTGITLAVNLEDTP